MKDLWLASLQFPTVVFTIGLGIALVYWLFVLLGALDIDLLGGGEGHGVDGGDVDGGMWHGLGLGAVPLTISVSVILVLGWVSSLIGMHYVVPHVGTGAWLPAVLLPVVLLLALPLAALMVRPLAPVFAIKEGKSNADYVGHTCTITTGSVDEGFGQATVEDGGTVLVIPVRCDRPGKLGRGDKAMLIEFDPARQAYVVEPTADMLGGPPGSGGTSETE